MVSGVNRVDSDLISLLFWNIETLGCTWLVLSCERLSRLLTSLLVVCSEELMCLVSVVSLGLCCVLLCSVDENSCVVPSGRSRLRLVVVRTWAPLRPVVLVLCRVCLPLSSVRDSVLACLVICVLSCLLVLCSLCLVCPHLAMLSNTAMQLLFGSGWFLALTMWLLGCLWMKWQGLLLCSCLSCVVIRVLLLLLLSRLWVVPKCSRLLTGCLILSSLGGQLKSLVQWWPYVISWRL